MLEQVITIAQEAGQAIMEIYQHDVKVELKEDHSPLTQADLASHHHIVKSLKQLTPAIPILSEESQVITRAERQAWPEFWLVDPLDGTKEFIKRNGEFTVNIALIRNGAPVMGVVHAPVLQLSYWGLEHKGAFKADAQGQYPIQVATKSSPLEVVASRSHVNPETQTYLDKLASDHQLHIVSQGSSLKFCLIAEGKAHLYPRLGPTMEWDTAAAQAVVEQAGGSVLNSQGQPLRYNKDNLLNPHFFVGGKDLRELMRYHTL